MVHLSPGIRASEPYPFEELDRRKAGGARRRPALIDFGVGDPRDETPAFIREALRDAIAADLVVPARGRSPRAARRRSPPGSTGASASPSIPTRTSSPRSDRRSRSSRLAQAVLDPAAGKRSRVGDRARLHDPRARRTVRRGRRAGVCRSPRHRTSSPTSTRSMRPPGAGPPILWLNYPNNPTGATAPLAFLRRRRRAAGRTTSSSPRTRRTASSGSRGTPRPRACRWATCTNVVVLNTLSKRSSMTGYRSGFVGRRPRADRGDARRSVRRSA